MHLSLTAFPMILEHIHAFPVLEATSLIIMPYAPCYHQTVQLLTAMARVYLAYKDISFQVIHVSSLLLTVTFMILPQGHVYNAQLAILLVEISLPVQWQLQTA